MGNEALAPAAATPPAAPSEDEYQTFCAALSASARGRAFLAEYARRHRGADTDRLLAALARLEALMRRQQADAQPAREALSGLLAAIGAARPEIAASALPARAAKLAQLIGLIERKIEALAQAPPPPPPPEPGGEARLAVVPPPEQPELPIPSPSAGERRLTLAHHRGPPPPASAPQPALPDVSWLDAVPPADGAAAATEPEAIAPAEASAPAAVAEADMPPPAQDDADEHLWALSTAKIAPPPDPLAALMLLSEEERLALFT
jgi:hypothetical protein